METIDLTSFENAINSLEDVINVYNSDKSNLETWDEYRQKRNMTSHTYDENAAKDVVAIIPAFKDEALFLLNRLKERL